MNFVFNATNNTGRRLDRLNLERESGLWITSLNSHFCHWEPLHKILFGVKVQKRNNPHRPYADGGVTVKGGTTSESPYSLTD